MALTKYERVKRWRASHKEAWAAQSKRRQQKRRKQIYAQHKAWRDRNLEHVRAKSRESKGRERQNNSDAQKRRNEAYKQRQEALLISLAGRSRPDRCELCSEKAKTCFDHCHASGK